jgi:serine/threonine-protein kinase
MLKLIMPAAPPEIGPYRLVRPLGQGGMGAVYLAYDTRLGREVALKLFSGPEAQSPFAREGLMREARAAAALNHAHIASVHDVLEVDGQVGIVFEYVHGETLAKRIARGRLSPAETVIIATQLADALAAAHRHGIIHRDLKPANIAITTDGVVKVLDFGVAHTMPAVTVNPSVARTTATYFVGTIGYAAPEQCLGQTPDAQADVFSLGVVMFEMVTGVRPFGGGQMSSVLRAMVKDDAPRPSSKAADIPGELDDLILRMLSADPERRPASALEVLQQLHGLTPTSDRIPLPARPRRRAWMLIALATTAGLIGALVGSLGSPRTVAEAAKTPVVGILPLANASDDPGKEYLAVGVADSLVTRLASLPSITVLSRSAVADARRRTTAIPTLAAELGASYFVDGSVQQIADGLRITLTLVRPDASVAWADTVEGKFSNIFALQTRLAASLSQALSVQLSAAERASLAYQPTMNVDALAAYWRGRTFLDRRDVSGNIDAALTAFDDAVRLDPRFADAHAGRGEALWARYAMTGDQTIAQQAINANTDALRHGPDRASVRYLLALTLIGTGRLSEGIDELQHALMLRSNYDEARRELAEALARQGRFDEAIDEVQKAVVVRSQYWGHYNTLGRIFLQAGRYPDAAAAFEQVVALQPDSFVGYAQLGNTFYFLGRNDEALANYEKAISLGADPRIWLNVGTLYHLKGEYQKAVAAYREALKNTPNVHVAHRNLGDALLRLGRRAEARASYERAIELAQNAVALNPTDAATLSQLAVYRAKVGRCADATTTATKSQSIAPDDINAMVRHAVVQTLCGSPEGALKLLQTAVQRGYSRQAISQDDDLASLRSRAEFNALVSKTP